MTHDSALRWYWIFLMALVLATVVFLGLGFYGLHQNHRFAVEGERTMGTVTRKDDDLSLGRYGGSRRSYYLAYAYRVAEMPYASAELLVAGQTWRDGRLDGPLPIIYLADDPSVSRIDLPSEDGANAERPWMAMVMGAVLFLSAVGMAGQYPQKVRHIT